MPANQILTWHPSRTDDQSELEASAPTVPIGYSDAYYEIRSCPEGRAVELVVLDMAGHQASDVGKCFGSFPDDEQAKTVATRDAYRSMFSLTLDA
jgi:hypothetical protein